MLLMTLRSLFKLLLGVGITAGSSGILEALDEQLLACQCFGEQRQLLCGKVYHYKISFALHDWALRPVAIVCTCGRFMRDVKNPV